MHALELIRVCRTYESGDRARQAVRDVSLAVEPGEVVALLGPNGAGKTTTAKIASTLLTPDSGEVRVCGVDALAHPREACANLSLLLGGDRGFYLRVSAADNLSFFATLAGVPAGEVDVRVKESLEAVGLTERAHDRVETFSRGMRQRLHIARALLSKPGLLLLDEPTTGLDPQSAADVRALVAGLRSLGAGILLTTHSMREAEVLSDRIEVIKEGSVFAEGTVAELAQRARIGKVSSYNTCSLNNDAVDGMLATGGAVMVNVTEKAGSWDIDVGFTDDEAAARAELPPEWMPMGERPATLEEVYLALLQGTGEGAQ